MPRVITDRVSVGVSACIYGCPVRYNGKALDALKVLGREKADFSFTPVCPECLAGFGVPRMPVHLTGTGQEVIASEARVRDRGGHDRTQALIEGSLEAIRSLERAGVEAFIAKEASPSCGLYKARVGKRRTEQAGGSGVFGAMLLERGWFLIPDEGLANPLLWWDWRRRLHAWLWLKRQPVQRARDLYEAWHVVKFVVQETNRPLADAVGRALAALPRHPDDQALEALRAQMLDALRAPSTRARIRGALRKAYAHARTSGELAGVDLHGVDIDAPGRIENVDTLVRELTTLERVSFENDLLFGTSPVIRRDRRRLPKDATSGSGGAVPAER